MSNSTFEEMARRVKNIPMDVVIDSLNLGPIGPTRKIRSIYRPDERTPSMHIYEYNYWCYATGQGGDQITFVRDALNVGFKQAVMFLAQNRTAYVKPREDTAPRWQDLTETFYGEPEGNRDDLERLEDHITMKWPTLSPEVIFDMGSRLTCNSELWTPHYHPEKPDVVVGVKIRQLYGRQRRKRSVPGSKYMQLYQPRGLPTFTKSTSVWLVEGESDQWCLQHHFETNGNPHVEYKVLGLPSGAGTIKPSWFEQIAEGAIINVAFDGDEAGTMAAQRVAEELQSVVTIEVPGGRVAEALAAGWVPSW